MAPLRFGLIGLGRFGKHYDRLLREIPGVELASVATRHSEIRTQDIFVDKNIDAVVIATPPSTHAGLILEALRAGKHVLVEKPMVTSVAEADAVRCELARGIVFMVGYQYVYNDHIRTLKKLLPSLGKIHYVRGEHLYNGPRREDVGCFMDASPHHLSLLEYLFKPGDAVTVRGRQLMFTNAERDDFTAATVTFASGLSAHLITSWVAPEKITKLTLVGEQGMAVYNDRAEENKLQVFDSSGTPSSPVISAREPLRNELEHFIDCIRTGATPLSNIDLGIRVTKWCENILAEIKRN